MTDDDWLAPIPRRKPLLLDGYPGEDIEPTDRSHWDEHDRCDFCGHDRLEHGDKKCHVHLAGSMMCGCPLSRDAE